MHKAILRLAIPNILTNLTVPLLGVVDTALMGNLDAPVYLAALGVGVAIFNFVYWGFGFLRMSTTGFTAQAFGADDEKAMGQILYRSMVIAGLIGLLLFALQQWIWQLGIWIINPDGRVDEVASTYFFIRIWAAPANLMTMVLFGWFLGAQRAVFPMVVAIVGNIVNIGFSALLVLEFDMSIAGVAWGTVVAQYLSLFIALGWLLLKYRSKARWPGWERLLDTSALKQLLQVNADIFIRTLCLIAVFTFFTAQSARYGNDILALNTVLLQLVSIVSYGIDGFAFASESLTGRFLGKRDPVLLRKAIRYIFGWGFALAIAISVIYAIFQQPIMKIFTIHQPVLELSKEFMVWVVLAPLVNCFAYLWDGIYIGATASKPMRNSMLAATLAIFLPLFYLLDLRWDNHALWLAFTVFMVARGGFLWAVAKRHIFAKAHLSLRG